MKKLVLMILFWGLIALAYGGPIDVNIYVDDAYKPFSFRGKDGNAQGIYINVLQTAFSRMKNFNVTIEPVPWNPRHQNIEINK